VVGHGMVAPAGALEHQGTVGIVRREKFGHGTPRRVGCVIHRKLRASCGVMAAGGEDRASPVDSV
jgi:hypothetical protein